MLSLKGKLATLVGLIVILVIGTSYTTNAETGTETNTENNTDVSRVEYFSLQSNTICDKSNYRSDFIFNLSNTSSVPVDATLILFKKDGSQFTGEGAPDGIGLSTDIIPGQKFTIAPHSTVQYQSYYGYSDLNTSSFSCEERPTYGKVVLNSDGGMLIGNGEFIGRRLIHTTDTATKSYWESYNNTAIEINSGKPF